MTTPITIESSPSETHEGTIGERHAKKWAQYTRNEIAGQLAILDAMERVVSRLHPDIIAKCHPHVSFGEHELMIYNCDREESVSAMKALRAGKWEKKICPGNSARIDYTATIDGITVQIYGTEPPPSCKIVEEEIEVPAHKEIKRTLVCK